jgi:hypothetical protein
MLSSFSFCNLFFFLAPTVSAPTASAPIPIKNWKINSKEPPRAHHRNQQKVVRPKRATTKLKTRLTPMKPYENL